MRYIHKGAADYRLSQRNNKPLPSTAIEAATAWNNFKSKKYTRIKCQTEQYGLCGYSEVSLTDKNPIVDPQGKTISRSLGVHLEHVEPKSRNPARTFDHGNLIACAIDDVKQQGLLSSEVFGGHAKGNWYHTADFIYPLRADCANYFYYRTDGKVVPKQGLDATGLHKAELTIEKLNLNSPVLVVWRKTWLQQAENIIDELLDDNATLRDFAETELLPVNGQLRPFHTAQRQLFGGFGEQVCQQHKPAL